MDAPISVFVIDDHEMVRRAMADYVARAEGFTLLGDGPGDRETLAAVLAAKPDVVVLDMEMPSISGAQFIEFLRVEAESPRVLVCSMHDAATYVTEAFRRGADGYILKRSPLPSLLEAVRRVASGEGYIDSGLHVDVIARFRDAMAEGALTGEELDVLRLAAQGRNNEQIAERLGTSVETIKHRLRRVFRKLGASDRAHAVAIALTQKLL
ncbi:MAG: response regulator transcription factor [Candidatus Binatia bacterium]